MGYFWTKLMTGQLKGEKVYRGIAVSAGVCRGKILILHRARHVITRRELRLRPSDMRSWSAVTPAPSSTANARTTSGPARGIDRIALPAC